MPNPISYCPSCGERLGDQDRYCPYCGHERPGGGSQERIEPVAGPQPTSAPGRRRIPWVTVAVVLASLAAVAGLAVLVALNWEPEERIGNVTAPRFDPLLAGGGLSSREVGLDVLVGSLKSSEPPGYQILADAVDEEVIDEFEEVEANGPWESAFQLNGGDFTLRFKGDKGEKRFLLNFPVRQKETADSIFAISRRYGFFSSEVSAALLELQKRLSHSS